MLPIEEVKKWLIENRTDGNGDLLASYWKVKKSLDQSHNAVGGDLNQDGQSVKGSIIYDLDLLNDGFKEMSPAEKGEFISHVFVGDDGKIRIEDVDLSLYHTDVEINRWTIDGSLSQCCHRVGGDLFQHHQEVSENLYQDYQQVEGNLLQDKQEAGGCIVQDRQEAKDEHKDEPMRKDESMCVAPDYEGECERLRKELAKANGKNEILLWALDKALGEDD